MAPTRQVWADGDRAGLAGQPPSVQIGPADESALADYRNLRRQVFCHEQQIFSNDSDDLDYCDRTVSLVARAPDGEIIGGVRIAPHPQDSTGAWWTGSRLAVQASHRGRGRIAAALVRSACSFVTEAGALRFDATVQPAARGFFSRLGWSEVGMTELAGVPHVAMRWPVDRFERLVTVTKASLGSLLEGLDLGGPGFIGDDAAPVPGSDLFGAADAILPSIIDRDPRWAGWCSVLVNINDLAAMGATPVALLSTIGASNVKTVREVLAGLRQAADTWGVPVIGGHTQIGVLPNLSVTALGRTDRPVPSGGGKPGHVLRLTADLSGAWRAGQHLQWDSSSARSAPELTMLAAGVALTRPAAAKDVSMAGLVGSLGMLAEASGCAAELDVANVPSPPGVRLADWMSCFPGFAIISAAAQDNDVAPPLPPGAVSVRCGRLVEGEGVRLVWPDGQSTVGIAGVATGLGPASGAGRIR